MFRSFLQAGFECGHLPFGVGDLLQATGHVPGGRMAANYAAVAELGIHTVRDGLPWRHSAYNRVQAAQEAGLQVLWDLCHFDPPPEPVRHAVHVAASLAHVTPPHEPVWVCPMNEPAICSMFNPAFSPTELAVTGLEMLEIVRGALPDVRCLTTDPIVGAGEAEYAATDLMVSTGHVAVVGVNYYPHTAVKPLRDVLVATWKRYGLPVLLSETSWHNGHQDHQGRFFNHDKAAWLHHVSAEIGRAQMAGATVVGCCWYPATDTPAWGGEPAIWDNGLIRLESSRPDAELAQAFAGIAA